jgi:hypothetical protein
MSRHHDCFFDWLNDSNIFFIGGLMASFNECEALHEIKITPDRLREIATEMERISKLDQFQVGQVIRFKLGHLFAFTYKPERTTATVKDEVEETKQ